MPSQVMSAACRRFVSQKETASPLGQVRGSVNAFPFLGPLGSCFPVVGRLVCRFRIGKGLPVSCGYLSLFVVLIFAFYGWVIPQALYGSRD